MDKSYHLEDQVMALRVVYKMVPRSLRDQFANMFDVHPATIKRAIHSDNWSHVQAIEYERTKE